MANQDNPQDDVQAGSEEELAEARDKVKAQAEEVKRSYERAKKDLADAVQKLREEVERLRVDQAAQKARDWVQENPVIAAMLAVGGGILVGRLLASVFRPAPPPPWPVRARRRAQELTNRVGGTVARRTEEVFDTLSRQAVGTGEILSEKAVRLGQVGKERADRIADELIDLLQEASKSVKEKSRQGIEVADTLGDAAKTVLTFAALKKASDWFRRRF